VHGEHGDSQSHRCRPNPNPTHLQPPDAQLILERLPRPDARGAALCCKAWRQALLPLLAARLRVVLSDVRDASTRTRGQSFGRWLDLPLLLRHAPPQGSRLELVLSERKWPSAAQMAALVDCVARQPRVSQLALVVLEELERLDGSRSKGLAALTGQLCDGLAAHAAHVTSIQLHTARAAPSRHLQICGALARLQGLRRLTCTTNARVRVGAFQPLGRLTGLTALTIGHRADWRDPFGTMSAMLHQLWELSQLESFRLVVREQWRPQAQPAELPPWPRLRHLVLLAELARCGDPQLRLSAAHCSRLESLEAPLVLLPEGVSSLGQLTSLRVASLRVVRSGLEQQQGAQAQGQPPAAQEAAPPLVLQLPQLRRLAMTHQAADGADSTLGVALALAAGCGVLEDLDLAEVRIPATAQGRQQAEQALALLQLRELPLRSLRLPGGGWGGQRDKPERWLQRLLAQHAGWLLQPLTRLHLMHELRPAEQRQLLGGCSSLRELSVRVSPSGLLDLPRQLTALTAQVGVRDGLAEQAQAERPAFGLTALRSLSLGNYTQQPAPLTLHLLTRLTSLSLSYGAASDTDISGLRQLDSLQCRPCWPGLAQQLLALRGLRSLSPRYDLYGHSEELVQAQAQQLGALTQLRELVLSPEYGKKQLARDLARDLGRALPHCLVRLADCASDNHCRRPLAGEGGDDV
jgi:hypothetical protein